MFLQVGAVTIDVVDSHGTHVYRSFQTQQSTRVSLAIAGFLALNKEMAASGANTVLYSVVLVSAALYSIELVCVVLYSIAQCYVVLYSIAQVCVVLYSIALACVELY